MGSRKSGFVTWANIERQLAAACPKVYSGCFVDDGLGASAESALELEPVELEVSSA